MGLGIFWWSNGVRRQASEIKPHLWNDDDLWKKIGMLSFGNLHKANILSQFWYKKRFTVQASNDLWSMGKKLPLPSSLLRIWGFSSEAPVIWSFLSLIPDAQVQNPKFAFYHPILTKELKINYQDHTRMKDKRPKKMYHSPDK